MGLFQKFLKEQLSVQLYGKLPLARDYLRVGASRGTGRELREWLDQSFSSMAETGSSPSPAWPMRLIMFSPDSEAVMGSMWASSDAGERRAFPFVTFIERRRKTLAAALEEEMSGLDALWNQLEECFEDRARYQDGESFLAAMRSKELVTAPKAAGAFGRTLAHGAWLDALWPEEGNEGLVSTLTSIGRLLKAGHDGPIRLPLVSNLTILPQVSAWHSALSELHAWPQGRPSLLAFPQEDAAGSSPAFATFLRGRPGPPDALWLTSCEAQPALGDGDFARQAACKAPARPTSESSSTLTDSVRGAMASARARI